MAWVQMVSAEAATGNLRALYQRVREQAGVVPTIAKLQSLRPESTSRGFDLYCQVMDDPTGISKWIAC
jgi:hypothetical protein